MRKNGKEYRFQDETISENSPRSKKVKIALYKCQERIQNQSLAKNILSSIDL